MIDYLLKAFSGPGAGFMYAILVLLAFTLAVATERAALLLMWRAPKDLNDVLARGEQPKELKDSPVSQVVGAGLAESDPTLAWEAMSAAAVEAEARISKRVAYLAAAGNISTMLGLLGTVYGLILAFSALGDASAGERAARLSEGISTAMATTAFGLLVGIPALGLHAWLEGVARSRVAELEAAAGKLALGLRRRASDG
ncbi:MAG: MotA/TolQ/ExbB proton channel family protein [Myxococcota bacterium]|nr:MotA/TolQ/ExbB proton channel family protein [Myxococcota bacterium]